MPRMQQRRDTAANWTSANPVLASGEFGLETDTGRFKVGNGSSAWSALDYVGVVSTVNGLTGNPVLDATTVSAVASVNSLSGALTIAAGSNVSISTSGSTITISATGDVASVNGLTGTVSISAGENVTVSTAGSTITIAAGGGGGGGDPVVTSVSVTASVNDYSLPAGDIFRISHGTTNTVNITGLATAVDGAAKLLINVSTGASSTYTIKHANTNSTAVSRILVPWAGDYVLSANGGAALVLYDATDSRWRVV